jgi:hypothetical protein
VKAVHLFGLSFERFQTTTRGTTRRAVGFVLKVRVTGTISMKNAHRIGHLGGSGASASLDLKLNLGGGASTRELTMKSMQLRSESKITGRMILATGKHLPP